MTDPSAAPRGHENSLMFDGVAPVTSPTPRVDAALLDAFAAPATPAVGLPVGLPVGLAIVGDAGASCGPDGCA